MKRKRKVDEESHKKILSLMEERKVIKEEIGSLQRKLDSVISKIEELDIILEDIRQNQGYIEVSSKQNENMPEQDSSILRNNLLSCSINGIVPRDSNGLNQPCRR